MPHVSNEKVIFLIDTESSPFVPLQRRGLDTTSDFERIENIRVQLYYYPKGGLVSPFGGGLRGRTFPNSIENHTSINLFQKKCKIPKLHRLYRYEAQNVLLIRCRKRITRRS